MESGCQMIDSQIDEQCVERHVAGATLASGCRSEACMEPVLREV